MRWDGPSPPPPDVGCMTGTPCRPVCVYPFNSGSDRVARSVQAAASMRAPPPLGADQRVHDLEVVDRPALVAGATSRAQAVNFMAYSDGCILLGVPAQHRCTTAAPVQHSTAAC